MTEITDKPVVEVDKYDILFTEGMDLVTTGKEAGDPDGISVRLGAFILAVANEHERSEKFPSSVVDRAYRFVELWREILEREGHE